MTYSQTESTTALANGIQTKTLILLVDNNQSLSGELLQSKLNSEPSITFVGRASSQLETF